MVVPASLIASIINGEYDDDLDRLSEAIRSRKHEASRRLAQVNKLTLTPGTRVRLRGLSPKYLNGLEGEVTKSTNPRMAARKGGTLIPVKLDDSIDAWQARARYGEIVYAPANCMEAI